MDPLELLDDVTNTLGLKVVPMNLSGMGKDSKGVVDLRTKEAILFEGERHGAVAATSQRSHGMTASTSLVRTCMNKSVKKWNW